MDTLRKRLQWVLDQKLVENASRWALAAGLERVHVGKLLERDSTDTGKVALDVIEKLARAANVSSAWLAYGRGAPEDGAVVDPSVAQFLLALRRLPGLEAWLEKRPGEHTIGQVAKVMSVYEMSRPSSQSDGLPNGGWDAYFPAALSGALSRVRAGDVEAADAAERAQMPKAAQKRLRSAPKK